MQTPTKTQLLELYREGLTDSQVAKRFRVSRQTVWRWRKEYGIRLDVTQVYRVRVKEGDE